MKTMLACQIGHITCSSGRNSSAGCGEPARMVAVNVAFHIKLCENAILAKP